MQSGKRYECSPISQRKMMVLQRGGDILCMHRHACCDELYFSTSQAFVTKEWGISCGNHKRGMVDFLPNLAWMSLHWEISPSSPIAVPPDTMTMSIPPNLTPWLYTHYWQDSVWKRPQMMTGLLPDFHLLNVLHGCLDSLQVDSWNRQLVTNPA